MANLEFQIHFKCSCVECRRACRHRGKMQTPLREAHGPGIEPVSIFRCRDAKVQGRQIDLCEDAARNRAIFCITTPSCPHAALPIDKVAFLRASALNQRNPHGTNTTLDTDLLPLVTGSTFISRIKALFGILRRELWLNTRRKSSTKSSQLSFCNVALTLRLLCW